MIKAIIVIIIGQFLLACSSIAVPQGACTTYLQRLLEKKAESEAERVALSNSPYILGVQGYTTTFPGTEGLPAQHKLHSEVIEGTSDSNLDASCTLYQREASDYAQRFNRHLLKLLQENLKH